LGVAWTRNYHMGFQFSAAVAQESVWDIARVMIEGIKRTVIVMTLR